MLTKNKLAVLLLSVFLAMVAAGCKKKAPAPPPPPPPPPPVVKEAPKPPVISMFTAEPSSIERGQSSTLKWDVSGATEVKIEPGIGVVGNSGTRTVFPNSTTRYTLTATGPGGSANSNATVNVTVPPPPPPPVEKPKLGASERLAREVNDAFFDYDQSSVRADAQTVLTRNADALKAIFNEFPGFTVVVEGHCDERGSAEYNLGLGDRRATSAKDFLVQLGVPADRLRTISYGKERPQCTESNEECWQRNRRAHFAPGQ